MKDEKPNKEPSIKRFAWFVGGILLLCAFYSFAVIRCIDEWEHRGQFGDMFGALNTMFSGAAFAGIVYAIILQRHELAVQREEMRLSREELAAQNTLITAQLATMQDSRNFERKKEDLASEPRLLGGAVVGFIPNRITIEVKNVGGCITDITLKCLIPATGLDVELNIKDVWNLDRVGELSIVGFGADPGPSCEFEMNYIDKLKRKQVKRYRIPAGSNKLEHLPWSDLEV